MVPGRNNFGCGCGNTGYNSCAFILVLFILLVIIGCCCWYW